MNRKYIAFENILKEKEKVVHDKKGYCIIMNLNIICKSFKIIQKTILFKE